MSNEKIKPEKENNLSQDFDAFSSFLETVDLPQQDEGSDPTDVHLHANAIDHAGHPVTFLYPQTAQPLSPTYLQASSIEVLDLLQTKDLTQRNLESFTAPVALPGDIIAHITNNKSDNVQPGPTEKRDKILSFEAGSHVRKDHDGNYIAERYGLVVLKESQLTIISPLRVEQNGLRLKWLVTADHPTGIGREMLESWVKDVGVTEFNPSTLQNLIEKNVKGVLTGGAYTLVKGIPPIHGIDGKIIWHVEHNRVIGQIQGDGRIDFKEQKFVTSVTAGKVLAEINSGVPGVEGKDIFGNKLVATEGKEYNLIAGRNVREEQSGAKRFFISEIDGAINNNLDRIEVFDVLTLEGDVNFETGNIDFTGSVIIRGSLKSGFSVKAGGDIFVARSVDNNVRLMAEGNIVVGNSINGNDTSVKAGFSVKANIINKATVFAGNDIELGSYAYFAKLRALGKVKVYKGSDRFGGGIAGGETWATEKIDTFIAGTESWAKTELVAGILPDQVNQMDELDRSISNKSLHLRYILDYFGLVEIDLKLLQKKIENAEGADRKRMAIRAKTLAKTGKALQGLIAEKKHLIAKLGPAPENAQISIRETLFPNVTISIGASRQKQNDISGPVRFYNVDKKIKIGSIEEEPKLTR